MLPICRLRSLGRHAPHPALDLATDVLEVKRFPEVRRRGAGAESRTAWSGVRGEKWHFWSHQQLLMSGRSNVRKMLGEHFVQAILRGTGNANVAIHSAHSAGSGEVGWEVTIVGVAEPSTMRRGLGVCQPSRRLCQQAGWIIDRWSCEIERRGSRVEVGMAITFPAGWWEVAKSSTGEPGNLDRFR